MSSTPVFDETNIAFEKEFGYVPAYVVVRDAIVELPKSSLMMPDLNHFGSSFLGEELIWENHRTMMNLRSGSTAGEIAGVPNKDKPSVQPSRPAKKVVIKRSQATKKS